MYSGQPNAHPHPEGRAKLSREARIKLWIAAIAAIATVVAAVVGVMQLMRANPDRAAGSGAQSDTNSQSPVPQPVTVPWKTLGTQTTTFLLSDTSEPCRISYVDFDDQKDEGAWVSGFATVDDALAVNKADLTWGDCWTGVVEIQPLSGLRWANGGAYETRDADGCAKVADVDNGSPWWFDPTVGDAQPDVGAAMCLYTQEGRLVRVAITAIGEDHTVSFQFDVWVRDR